jgi:hypothetical protein
MRSLSTPPPCPFPYRGRALRRPPSDRDFRTAIQYVRKLILGRGRGPAVARDGDAMSLIPGEF